MKEGIVWCPHCRQPHLLSETLCTKTGKPLTRGISRSEPGNHPLIGKTIDGKYRVLKILGQGGVGIVFEGLNVVLQRPVAIKIVNDRSAAERVERLKTEARIVASLQHPNVCDIYDFGEVPPFGPYLVTERLHGETLAQRFHWQPTFSVPDTIEIIVQMLSGLHAAHGQNIVHRDVKPQNVFLIDRLGCPPVAKILDFGMAKDLSANAAALTRPGRAVGTPQYMAPEQLRGEPVGPASDIFAVGVILYEMLTRRHPFSAGALVDMQVKIVRENPRPPSTRRRGLPLALDAVVMRALAKEPRARFADAYAMQRELLRAIPPGYEDPSPESTPPSS